MRERRQKNYAQVERRAAKKNEKDIEDKRDGGEGERVSKAVELLLL